MYCENCKSPLLGEEKFCGKCGSKVTSDTVEIFRTIKIKAVNGIKIFLNIAVFLFILGILTKASTVIVTIITNILTVLLGVNSNEGLDNIEAITNILSLLSGAYLAHFVYTSMIGKVMSSEKKKWYQFAYFTSTEKRTKAHPTLAVIIIVIAIVLSTSFDLLKAVRQKTIYSGEDTYRSHSWVMYNAPESNFSVKIPSTPVHDTSIQNTVNGKIKVDSYKTADETASVAYIVNVAEYPKDLDLSDSSGILENTVKLSSKDGTILTSKQTTHNGYPAVVYLIEFVHPTTVSIIKGLNILVGHRLYQVLTAYDKPNENKLEFEKFTNSFEIN